MQIYSLTEIKESTIHGLGRFAVENISKGSVVLYIEGTLSNKGNEHKSYINHSTNGNLTYVDGNFIAKENIFAGDELTWDYTEVFSNVQLPQ